MSYSGGGGGGRGRGKGGGRRSVATPSSSTTLEIGSSSSSASADLTSLTSEVQARLSFGTSTNPSPESSKTLNFLKRPDYCTAGTQCVVRANHFLVNSIDKDFYHYDVSITPEVVSVNRAVMNFLVWLYRHSHLGGLQPVYDGCKGLFTAGPLPFSSKEFVIKLGEMDEKVSSRREREFKVAIKFASKIDQHRLQHFLSGRQRESPQETIEVLDIVLKEKPSNDYTVVRRSFFSLNLGTKSDAGDGLEIWRGYYQSLRPTQMGLSLNIDVAATTFYEAIPVVEYVCKLLNLNISDRSRPLTDIERAKVKKALKGVQVEFTHRKGRHKKITGITAQSTDQLMFNVNDSDEEISVSQYFLDEYKISLCCPRWPALQAGTDSRPLYLPMGVCTIVGGQRYSKKLNKKQVTAMLMASCQRSYERESNIHEMAVRNNYGNDAFAREFGITVEPRLVTIGTARVLQPPVLKYLDIAGNEVRIQPQLGQWNMGTAKMVNGCNIQHWTCVNFSSGLPTIASRFCKKLVSMCSRKGMIFKSEPLIPVCSVHHDQIESALVEIHNQSRGQLQLLIIILPDLSGSYYGTIKRICETELGIISQCCQPKHAQECNNQYLNNMALKINVKAGGRNTVLMDPIPLVSDCPTIIFGADVSHPSPGDDSSPSIAAVVASMDWPEVTKYIGLVSAQTHRKELIQDLYKVVKDPQKGEVHAGMIRELLMQFYKSTDKRKPKRIIFYRDGVGEGQFNQVLDEVDAIRKACASIEEGYLPPITFVVVQKRHHTRLFPADHGNRSGNILPGTVVDTRICHPSEFDFYLCSHAGIKGTSRPTHYHVLWDENGFTSDQMQTLTNNLCYTYVRCTQSVSVVPPVYYAHLAAFRARYYIEGNVSESNKPPATRGKYAEIRPLPTIKENVKNVMFYC